VILFATSSEVRALGLWVATGWGRSTGLVLLSAKYPQILQELLIEIHLIDDHEASMPGRNLVEAISMFEHTLHSTPQC
jgi:hypothetical protein